MVLRGVVLLGILFFVSYNAFAESMVSRQGADYVRLTKKPCIEGSVLTHIPEEYRQHFRAGRGFIGGADYPLCWAMRRDGNIQLIYPDGETGVVPPQMFSKEIEG